MMISGDLGRNGEIPLLVELIAPVYDEKRHDPMAGINLLRAYQELGNPDEGEKLLSRMYALDYPPLKQYLDESARAFQTMREQHAQGTPPIRARWKSIRLPLRSLSGSTGCVMPTGFSGRNRKRQTQLVSLC
jgi:hypothetical protein